MGAPGQTAVSSDLELLALFQRSFIARRWVFTKARAYNWRGMLPDSQLSRVSVVLVRARNPANIGAVARAMHDFGFSSLRVVNEFLPPLEPAKSAVDAAAVCLWELVRTAGSPQSTDSPESDTPGLQSRHSGAALTMRGFSPGDIIFAEPPRPSLLRGDNPAKPEPVPAGSLERITELFNDVLDKSEYTRRHAASSNPI